MKKWNVVLASALSLLLLGGCSKEAKAPEEGGTVTVGVAGENEEKIWTEVSEKLKDENIDLKVQLFSDYVQPNRAVQEGEIDMNAMQHVAYLLDYNKNNNADLVPIGYTYISAMVVYSDTVKDLKDLPQNAKVAIPNDATNGGRALLLLEQAGVLEIDDNAGITPTVNDITSNPKNIELVEMDAAQVPRALKDSDAIVANTNYAVSAGFDPNDGIFSDTDDLDNLGTQYKNIIAVKSENKDNEVYKKIVKAYQSEDVEKKIKEISGNADQKAWTDNDQPEEDFHKLQEEGQK
ncbi:MULTISPECIES: MetQ/NlpA family ABC transporter substrate-binding protein [Aerococcus]|uniref:Lipoprotein n=4 Tax=Lactobacillales TaxID=186826 RepID=A0ABT4C6P8_9LACT|nr:MULTISPECIES: MetQ/NlpA family ABC transporter substrate-binding protein [Aerococcus]AMB95477.1 methionine ABC transporter substrate-binding protein [Aerococcus urinae]KAA9242720.1 MetQ/NlpA family ABC transporter substrate-binding protein [Aerococcus urinae]KAA9299907.1 MetQ/NlpA family ABC transporter substrate-binding protein [Aerococcus tenax]MCY3032665.1 MetQ/NlpA family ABC transporter substrate-binding protein [Aerococcus urinae]MCY3037966.1 MetQ/NlpA family ABC transporter substrate